MKRRAFVAAIGAMAGLSPRVILAQARRPWKVGLLMPNSTDPHLWNALKSELAKRGYAEGRDITFIEGNADEISRAFRHWPRILSARASI